MRGRHLRRIAELYVLRVMRRGLLVRERRRDVHDMPREHDDAGLVSGGQRRGVRVLGGLLCLERVARAGLHGLPPGRVLNAQLAELHVHESVGLLGAGDGLLLLPA